jgi:hypothetical protein
MTVTEIRPADTAHELRTVLLGDVYAQALQLGFAWQCQKDGHEVAGTDRGEYEAHMRGEHGARAAQGTKPIRLPKRPPAARLGKLEVSPFKWLSWTETRSKPGQCECGHAGDVHVSVWARDGGRQGCSECECSADYVKPDEQTAERRGQFWAAGPPPHSLWVLPSGPAPWEDGQAAPVLVYAGRPGRAFTDAYSAKYDRR